MADDIATTILDYLTRRNPELINHEPNTKTPTKNVDWHTPRQFKKWTEFSPAILPIVFNGSLFDNLNRVRNPPLRFPQIDPSNLEIHNEENTRDLYNSWNKYLVVHALRAVNDYLGPVIWTGPIERRVMSSRSTSIDRGRGSRTPQRAAKSANRSTPRPRIIKPDGGAAPDRLVSSHGLSSKDWLPKDYKTYKKWTSDDVVKLVNANDGFDQDVESNNALWPIRQIYTYCAELKCRYGCILTTGEAFIVRVGPSDVVEEPENSKVDKLTYNIINNGRMEYISIPWGNFREDEPDALKEWTVNLALWTLHVLAGNSHELDWDYGVLSKQKLAMRPLQTETPATTPARSMTETSNRTTPATPNLRSRRNSEGSTSTQRQTPNTRTVLGKRKLSEGASDEESDGDSERSSNDQTENVDPIFHSFDEKRSGSFQIPNKEKKSLYSGAKETNDSRAGLVQSTSTKTMPNSPRRSGRMLPPPRK